MKRYLKSAALVPLLGSLAVAQTVSEGPEPNNTPLTATHYELGQQAFGEISVPGDQDWWQVTLTAAADLRAMTGPGFEADVKDTVITLMNAAGLPMALTNDNYTGRGNYSEFTAYYLPAGVYYVEVRGQGTHTGSYVLDILTAPAGDLLPHVQLTPTVETTEPNDPRIAGAVATPVALFTRSSGSISVGGGGQRFADPVPDYDFYEFAVTTRNTVVRLSTMATATLAAPVCQDTCIFLVDSSMNVLALNDNFGATLWSELEYTVVTPGNYYAVVKGFGTADIGPYLLDVVGPVYMPDRTAASFTAHAGGCVGTAGIPHLDTRGDGLFGIHSELPLLGTEFCVDVTHIAPNALLLKLLGVSPPAAPLDLGAMGAPGCLVEVNSIASEMVVSGMLGYYIWPQTIPYVREAVGLRLEMQVGVMDVNANALGVTVSNRATAIVGFGH